MTLAISKSLDTVDLNSLLAILYLCVQKVEVSINGIILQIGLSVTDDIIIVPGIQID